MSVVDDLKAAREIVAQRWHKGGLEDGHGNVCAVGALNLACMGMLRVDNQPVPVYYAAYRALERHIPTGFNGLPSLPSYNDADGVTREDMLDLFDKALAELGGLA